MVVVSMITFQGKSAQEDPVPTAARPKPTAAPRDTWTVYQTMFTDQLEAVNAAPMTIRTYGLPVAQLGAFLRERGMPTDPTGVTREHLTEWLRHLQRPKDDGGQGLTAQSALQRY